MFVFLGQGYANCTEIWANEANARWPSTFMNGLRSLSALLAPSAFAVASALTLAGVDAAVKAVGAAPFVEPELRLLWFFSEPADEPCVATSGRQLSHGSVIWSPTSSNHSRPRIRSNLWSADMLTFGPFQPKFWLISNLSHESFSRKSDGRLRQESHRSDSHLSSSNRMRRSNVFIGH
jgi:hypothetical protein